MSDQDDDGNPEVEESLATRRGRRSRGDKGGRLAALEKLKNLRGSKNKYEVRDVENVYDVVDEDTYSKKVNDRLKDDWIVDDGTGYCETGHELFDDDIVDDDVSRGHKRDASRKSKKEKPSKEQKETQKAGFLSVRDMLTNMPTKRKRADLGESSNSTSINEDDLLGDLLQELHEEKKPKTSIPTGRSLLESVLLERYCETGHELFDDDIADNDVSRGNKRDSSRNSKKEKPSKEQKETQKTGFLSMKDMLTNMPTKLKRADLGESSNSTSVNDDDLHGDILQEFHEEEEPKTNIPTGRPLLESVLLESVPEIKVDFMTEGKMNEHKVMNFYWFDIYEEPRNPGFLYVFGKVKDPNKGYVSCCVILKNVERCMYLLPREKSQQEGNNVSFVDVYEEFTDVISKKFRIPQFKARKVEKKYCFGENNVPALSEYMEVRYSGTLPSLPEDLEGNTFSRVFGASSSMLENLLLEKKLKGPSWLLIKNPIQVESGQQQSWCKMEFTCEVGDMTINSETNKLPIPPFVVASLTITSVNDAAAKKDTIISLSVAINKSFNIQSYISNQQAYFHDSFCLLHKPQGEVWPFDVERALDKCTSKMDSERSMLACFLAKMQLYDPDIYIGHDINFDLLLLQLWNHKVPHWSRIGRLKRSSQPQKGSRMPDSKTAISGRLACDVKISAMELIRARSYDLPSLSVQVLGMKEDQVITYTGGEIKQLFESTDGIRHLIQWGMSMSLLNLRLVNELQVMPLALQITTIAGNTLSRTLLGGRSERNEFLLLHAFHSKSYIVPDKSITGKRFKREAEEEDEPAGDTKVAAGKSKSGGPSYAGGLVLEPKKGFYDNFIVLMDFNSLYPSIIQEFNICFTTNTTEDHTDESERGILPDEIRKLVESRKQVKQLMKADNLSQELKRQYDIRQKALKLTANSMYGCLGFRNSRFYAKNLAALITGKGREILLRTKDAVEKMGFEVIYGDTDSLMINTNTQEIQKVYQIGNKIKVEINRMYRLLELEIDGVFRFLLLLKKKKYAALLYNVNKNGEVETSLEIKGLDMVRRDWAPVAALTARAILDEIMTEQPLDDKLFKIVKILNDKAEELRSGKVPLKELLITKQLAKNPDEYKNSQGLYHVQVAIRMNANGKLAKKFKNGDTVSYLFCNDGLAHHQSELLASKVSGGKKEEVVKTENEAGEVTVVKTEEPTILEPNPMYYLTQQLHPVVSRICEPIPGLDAARIAEALGIDPSSYKKRRVVENNQDDGALGEMSEAEKYRGLPRFSFRCVKCRKDNVIESPYIEKDGKIYYSLSKCGGCDTISYNHLKSIRNSLTMFIRRFVKTYYEGWYTCEDPSCTNRERTVPIYLERGYFICACKQGIMVKEYTDSDLNKQLNSLLYAFDTQKRLDEIRREENLKKESVKPIGDPTPKLEIENAYLELSMMVNQQLQSSSYSQIKLGYLFSDLMPNRKFTFGDKNKK